jgi:hypothetical protein
MLRDEAAHCGNDARAVGAGNGQGVVVGSHACCLLINNVDRKKLRMRERVYACQ